jgi:hypothetical protein
MLQNRSTTAQIRHICILTLTKRQQGDMRVGKAETSKRMTGTLHSDRADP